MSSPSNGASSITFTMPSGSGYNTEYSSPISLYLQCTAFLMPPSETAVSLIFNFRRNSDLYMILSTPVNALGTVFNSSNGEMTQTSTAMVATNSATFNFLLGQPLTSNPSISFLFPTQFTLPTASCSASILTLTLSSLSCTLNTNTIIVTFTAPSSIPTATNVTIIINGVINPSIPMTYYIGMTTYYSSTVSSS